MTSKLRLYKGFGYNRKAPGGHAARLFPNQSGPGKLTLSLLFTSLLTLVQTASLPATLAQAATSLPEIARLQNRGVGQFIRQQLDPTFRGLYQPNAFDLMLLIPYFVVLDRKSVV